MRLGDRILQFNPYHGRDGRFAPRAGVGASPSFANETPSGRSPTAEEVVAGQAVTHINGKTGTFTGKYGNYQGRRVPEVQWSDGKKDIYDLNRLRVSESAKPAPVVEKPKPVEPAKPTPKPTPQQQDVGQKFAEKKTFDYNDQSALKTAMSSSSGTFLKGSWQTRDSQYGRTHVVDLPNGNRFVLTVGYGMTQGRSRYNDLSSNDSKSRHSVSGDVMVFHGGQSFSVNFFSKNFTGDYITNEPKIRAAKEQLRAFVESKFGITDLRV